MRTGKGKEITPRVEDWDDDTKIFIALAERPHTRRHLEALGRQFFADANEGDVSSLSKAFVNGERVTSKRCVCAPPPSPFYFARPDGRRGWACSECLGIQQERR